METTPAPAAPARRRRSRAPFPVTVTQMPMATCQVCGRALAHRKGEVSAILTAHYERDHPELLGR
ncbi:MAG: hypothetical protein HY830_08040 [Actinobacteria bacterium]|nr:hypothetical protein [Actinomycetota bacterium]